MIYNNNNSNNNNNSSAAGSSSAGSFIAPEISEIRSLNGTTGRAPRVAYKKTSEVIKILPEFNGHNISVNQFIRECKDAERFVDPADKDFFIRLVKSKITENARAYLQHKTFQTIDELLAELKRSFEPTQSLSQIQADLPRVMQKTDEKVSDYRLKVTKILQKAIEYINEHFDVRATPVMVEGSINTAVEYFILGLNHDVAIRMIGKNPGNLEAAIAEAINCGHHVKQRQELRGEQGGVLLKRVVV